MPPARRPLERPTARPGAPRPTLRQSAARRDLERIYARDPMALQVVCPAPGAPAPDGRRATRGVLHTRQEHAAASGGRGPQLVVTHTTLRVVAGSLGAPAADTVLLVGARRYRLLAELAVDGAGDEEVALLVAESDPTFVGNTHVPFAA